MTGWKIEGEYMETCNCAFLCPCITSNLAATPTEGDCKFAIAMRVDKGSKDGVSLDGVKFIVLARTPSAMAEGNMTVGVIVDEAADEDQTRAIAEIASGEAGGPMAALAPLVAENAGIEKRPISFEMDGLERTVKAGELIQQSVAGIPSMVAEGEPMYIDNTAHPVSPRLGLAYATDSHMHAFGIDWDDASGLRNGHLAKFAWSG